MLTVRNNIQLLTTLAWLLYNGVTGDDSLQKLKIGHKMFCRPSMPDVVYFTEKEDIQIWKIFSSVNVKVTSRSNAFQVKVYEPSELANETVRTSTKDFQSWLLSWMQPSAWYTSHTLRFSPFQRSHFMLSFRQLDRRECQISSTYVYLETRMVAMFVAGLLLVLFGPFLSRNILFHYTSAVAVGMLASWVVALFILCKFIPFKRTATAFLVVGSSFGLFIVQRLGENFIDLIHNHFRLFLSYFAAVGCITLATVYYFGPVKSVRTLNLLQWLLQIIGLVLLYNCTQVVEVSVTFVVIAIMLSIGLRYFDVGNIARKAVLACLPWQIYNRLCYGKPRLLTLEEYEGEGIRETKKALADLRQYMSSPGCDSWKYVSRLKDPKRFADFMEHGKEFQPEEVEEYEKYEEDATRSPWYSSDEDISRMDVDDDELDNDDTTTTTSFIRPRSEQRSPLC